MPNYADFCKSGKLLKREHDVKPLLNYKGINRCKIMVIQLVIIIHIHNKPNNNYTINHSHSMIIINLIGSISCISNSSNNIMLLHNTMLHSIK
ncbi:hypothetical protein O3M35_003226 [Rhynocoris fuscipes]|uniref:Uncharacterized protein n=1 Tax=Rhynocoris fuscipes TaxID=488301 RepID=A0AAW1CMC2_9HEMI